MELLECSAAQLLLETLAFFACALPKLPLVTVELSFPAIQFLVAAIAFQPFALALTIPTLALLAISFALAACMLVQVLLPALQAVTVCLVSLAMGALRLTSSPRHLGTRIL